MSTHIAAKKGEIADTVLLPGDPLRAKYIAETFLQDVYCYTSVRNMLGFTGTYKGKKVSVQGTGMGQPSISIYANELFSFYDVQTAIRVGTCGAIHESTKLRDVILAQGACSDSFNMNQRFGGLHYAPIANFELLQKASIKATEMNLKTIVGNVASSDLFYDENNNWKLWANYGVCGIEMETAELYTLAAKFNRKALAILTVSDHIATGESTTAEERQITFNNMLKLALETVV